MLTSSSHDSSRRMAVGYQMALYCVIL